MKLGEFFTAGTAGLAIALGSFIIGVHVAPTTSDGYTFNKVVGEQREALIVVQTYQSTEELQRAAQGLGIIPERLVAFTQYNDKTKLCTIHIVDPKQVHAPQFIGHEVLHCVYGNWHDPAE